MEDAVVSKLSTVLALWSPDMTSHKNTGVAALTLLLLGVFSNPILLNAPTVWKLSGELCQSLWNQYLDRVGDDAFWTWFWSLLIAFNGTYWIVASFYTWMDVTLKPETLRKYKTQPGVNEPLDKKRLRNLMSVVVFNQTVVTLPVLYLVCWAMTWRTTTSVRELPSLSRGILTVLAITAVEEIVFYYVHRLLHHRQLYRHIHKIHHEWTSPVAMATIYCHPVEHVFSNVLPPMVGMFLTGAHVSVAMLVTSFFLAVSMSDHSGYHLPFCISPEFHDFHHLKSTQCFGSLGIMDRLHGTDSMFVSSGYSRRHRVLRSLVPMREQVPLVTSNGTVK